MPVGTRKGELWRLFEKYGEIVNIFVPTKRNKAGEVFSFVGYNSYIEANEANKLNGNEMKVNKARFTKEQDGKNKKPNEQQDGSYREKDGLIHGVFNTEIQDKMDNSVWLIIKGKKREIEEIEYICTKLEIQWGEICTKG